MMKRTISNKRQSLLVQSALLSRARLMARLGQQYDGDRDLYEALGYQLNLDYDKYCAKYERLDIAKAIIDRPINKTWRGKRVELKETDVKGTTKFESEFHELSKRLKLKSKFIRLDKLCCLGEYAILFFGFSDVKDDRGFENPVRAGRKTELAYVKPFGQGEVEILTWGDNTNSARYGMPEIYSIPLQAPSSESSKVLRVHHSRVLHVTRELLQSETDGVPILKAIYNRLEDLEKIVGGSAEMFWRGARPGYQGIVSPDYHLTSEMEDDLQDQLDEMEHNLRRYLVNEGIKYEALDQQVVDPRPHVQVQMQMISAITGLPMRWILGSELGELASSEDRQNVLDVIEERREEHAEANIIRPFVEHCVNYGVLSPPKKGLDEYSVIWSDLRSKNDHEKAETGRIRATALKEYSISPISQRVVDIDSFLEYCLGLTEEQVNIIRERRGNEDIIEDEEIRRLSAIMDPRYQRTGGEDGE